MIRYILVGICILCIAGCDISKEVEILNKYNSTWTQPITVKNLYAVQCVNNLTDNYTKLELDTKVNVTNRYCFVHDNRTGNDYCYSAVDICNILNNYS